MYTHTTVTAQQAAQEVASANSLDYTVQDSTSTRGGKRNPPHKTDATSLEQSGEGKRISLAQAEKNIVSRIDGLISENTARIVQSLFSSEVDNEFKKQISELENDNQKRNANILRVMQENFLGVESGLSFVEFRANVSGLRAKAVQEYKERFEAEKLKAEKRKAIETQISALDAVRSIIGETAYNNGVNALREQFSAI